MLRLILIFCAGGCGCLFRYGLAGWIQRFGNSTFPSGTLVVNVLGCLAIGFLAALFTGPILIRDEYRLAILVGLLGGFTTFSTFAFETVNLTTSGLFFLAALNVLLSNALGLGAAWLGSRLALLLYGS
ncbi:MAG: fluoride efflux transporter CrcB [Phycisphaerales bacterium]|nr:fluoride efflux transporter CrcB [Phycisphaerales bacterium]